MSLPWSKSVELRLAPGLVEAVLATGWPSRRILASASRSIDPNDFSIAADSAAPPSVTGTSTHDVAIDSVLQELRLSASLRGAHLLLELDDELVQLDVASGDFGSQSDAQLQAIASACMAELIGDPAIAHEVRWSLQAGERHLLICAVPRLFLAAATAAAKLHGMRFTSAQPSFPLRWNAFAKNHKSPTAVFVVASARHAVIAFVTGRVVCAISAGAWKELQTPLPRGSAPAPPLDATCHTATLDARVDRLLASLGVEAAVKPKFILVASDIAHLTTDSRWSVIQAPGRFA